MNKYFRQKINKTTVILIDTIGVTLNLYFQGTILKKKEYTVFSNAQGTFKHSLE